MIVAVTILGRELICLRFGGDAYDGDPGPGVSADLSVAPGFVPDTRWWEEEEEW